MSADRQPPAHHQQAAGTHGRARLSFASDADIDEFADVLGQFERGEITPEQWRVFRLVRGTYGQRQLDDAQMIRVTQAGFRESHVHDVTITKEAPTYRSE